MPRGDGTGPAGMGSMTVRGAGFCAGSAVPGSVNWGGRGWRHWFRATGLPCWMRFSGRPAPHPQADEISLRNRVQVLQEELDFIKKRLSETENGEQP
jgi:hypothetical protein